MTTLKNKVEEVRNTISALIDNTDNTRKLALKSGVDQSVIFKLANGQKSFDNLRLTTVEKLYRIAIEFSILDKAENNKITEDKLLLSNNVEEIEEGRELFTDFQKGQYGLDFQAINKGIIYYKDGTQQVAVITYDVNEIKPPKIMDYENLWEAYCEDTTGSYQERTFYLLNNEEADIFMELQGAMPLYDLIEENKTSYVVDINRIDETLYITTQEGDYYFEYHIGSEYLKDSEYILNLIKDENLDSKFHGEDVTEDEPLVLEYKIKDLYYYLNKK